MLPAAHRLRRSGDFATTVRRGRRVARGCVVVHLLRPASLPFSNASSAAAHSPAFPALPGSSPAQATQVDLAVSSAAAPGVTMDTSPASEVLAGSNDSADPVDKAGASGGEAGASGGQAGAAADPARAGFVVSKAVGGAVVRNRVKRRLRHLMAERIDRLPPGATIVVRAQPGAALRRYQEMALDLENALAAALRSGRRQ